MLIEDFATKERCHVAIDLDFKPDQHVDGRRWVVVDGNMHWKRGEVPPEYR